MKSNPFGVGIASLSAAMLAACQTQQQTAALECGAGGALATYALCKAMGHSDHDCLIAGGAGGALVATGCYAYAGKLDRERAQLKGREGNLDARIAYVHNLNVASEQLNSDLTKRVADVTKSTDQLVAQIQKNQLTADQLAKVRQSRDADYKAAEAQLAKSNDALAELKTYKAQYKPSSPDFDASLAKLEQSNATTKQLVAQMSIQNSRVV